MSFPAVDRTILSAKDKKNLAGAQELAALLTDLDIQRHKVQHALRDMSEYLPKCDNSAYELIYSVVEKYRVDFDKSGFVAYITPRDEYDMLTTNFPASSKIVVAIYNGTNVEQVGLTYYTNANFPGQCFRSECGPVCEIRCLVQYDDRVQAFTFYLLQDLIDHLESVFLSLLAG